MPKSTQPRLRLAIFDFDGTLCRLNSYHIFLRWLMARPALSSLAVAAAVALRRSRLLGRPQLMRLALRNLRGKTRDQVGEIGGMLYLTKIAPALSGPAIAEMRLKREQGYRVVVLSGAFDFLIEPFCEAHGIHHWRSTKLAYADGVCAGALDGGEFLGEAKKRHLEETFQHGEVDWSESCVYSDELVDLPIFRLAGNKCFVVAGEKPHPPLPPGFTLLRW